MDSKTIIEKIKSQVKATKTTRWIRFGLVALLFFAWVAWMGNWWLSIFILLLFIILFHNDAKYTPQVLDTILKGLKGKGYEIVPVSQLIHRGEFELDHEGRQIMK